jgi:hypothetical protein
MRRAATLLASLLSGVVVSVAAIAPAEAAAPPLRFHGALYDTPGKDTPVTNIKLNNEWISLINSGARSVNLSGFTIRDKANHVYRFGNLVIAGKGGRVWLHTGSGKNTARNVHWGSRWYIWNNTGDTAYLRNASGKPVDTCTWGYRKYRTWVAC